MQPNTVYTMSGPNNLIFPEANYLLHKCAFKILPSCVEVAFRGDFKWECQEKTVYFLFPFAVPLRPVNPSKAISRLSLNEFLHVIENTSFSSRQKNRKPAELMVDCHKVGFVSNLLLL